MTSYCGEEYRLVSKLECLNQGINQGILQTFLKMYTQMFLKMS